MQRFMIYRVNREKNSDENIAVRRNAADSNKTNCFFSDEWRSLASAADFKPFCIPLVKNVTILN